MRLMGIDYGTKRVGVALSNDDGTMAFPHDVLAHTDDLAMRLAALAMHEHVSKIVVGKSHDLAGAPNKVQTAIDDLIEELRTHTGLLVEEEPEQFTTQAALRTQGRNEKTDASAAALILDSYITRQKNHT